MEGISLGETTIAELVVMCIEYCRDTGSFPDLVKINNRVAVCLVVILDSEPPLDVLGDTLEVVAPAIHRLLLLAESTAKVDVDLCGRGVRKTDGVHDLTVDAQVADAVGDNMLAGRGKTIELSRMKAEALVAGCCELSSVLQACTNFMPIW